MLFSLKNKINEKIHIWKQSFDTHFHFIHQAKLIFNATARNRPHRALKLSFESGKAVDGNRLAMYE